ncbi:hypothetical protein QU967_22875, partial [Escherichia coli]|nr:hypothetical protein [Escherichia coli]MDZ6767443.1 hypothetical protein [Escherichia coli]
DRNRSHWSTSKTPSYTKSVSWQHHQYGDAYASKNSANNIGNIIDTRRTGISLLNKQQSGYLLLPS